MTPLRDNEQPSSQQPTIKDLINIKEWQKIQDNFSAITDVDLCMVDAKGNFITTNNKEPRLCAQVLKNSSSYNKICGPCLPTFLGGQAVLDKNLSFICEAGVCKVLAPLHLENWVFGYLLVGPVILVMRKAKEEYRRVAEEVNVELDDLWKALLEIKVMSFQGMQSLVELIRYICEYTVKFTYSNTVEGKDMTVADDFLNTNRLLSALLEVAFLITGADVGSVMFFDKGKSELSIRASRGISEEIINTAKVRLGDGISGIAAKEKKAFLIDDNLNDSRIRSYLNRPYISSSMVIPINVQDSVAGVINLGALKTSAVRFNIDNLHSISKLVDLAAVALHD